MAEVELGDLLKYKTQLSIKNNAGKTVKKVWIRLLGDYDLGQAYKLARMASAKRRADLRNHDTDVYKEDIQGLRWTNSVEECRDAIVAARTSNFISDALSNTNREDLPKMEEISDNPDAPSLEEQEKLDRITQEMEDSYQKSIEEYIDSRTQALKSELSLKSDDEIFDMMEWEMSNILALQEFQNVLTAQKMYRGLFLDEACKTRAFRSLEDFVNSSSIVKSQIISAYNDLELSPDEIKK